MKNIFKKVLTPSLLAASIAVGTANAAPLPPPAWWSYAEISSTGMNNTPANSTSATVGDQALSGNGRFVVFMSLASNLVPNDVNNNWDLFVRNLKTGVTEQVNVDSQGQLMTVIVSASTTTDISDDGRFVVFTAGDSIYRRDQQLGSTVRVDMASPIVPANGISNSPCISGDGRYVGFTSYGTNLVPNDTNMAPDIFVRDTQTGVLSLASVHSSGQQGSTGQASQCTLSADGRYIAFTSNQFGLTSNVFAVQRNRVYRHDNFTGETIWVGVANEDPGPFGGVITSPSTTNPSISADGNCIAFEGDAGFWSGHAQPEVYLRNVQVGTTHYGLVDYTGGANGPSFSPSISADCQWVTYVSSASNLVKGDLNGQDDIFLVNVNSGEKKLVNIDRYGRQGLGNSSAPSISNTGGVIAFTSVLNNWAVTLGVQGQQGYDVITATSSWRIP